MSRRELYSNEYCRQEQWKNDAAYKKAVQSTPTMMMTGDRDDHELVVLSPTDRLSFVRRFRVNGLVQKCRGPNNTDNNDSGNGDNVSTDCEIMVA